jgi:hypothetical protein
MLDWLSRLLLGSTGRAGDLVLDAEARVAMPPRALEPGRRRYRPDRDAPVPAPGQAARRLSDAGSDPFRAPAPGCRPLVIPAREWPTES